MNEEFDLTDRQLIYADANKNGTINETDYRINFETKKIYIGKFSDLLDEEKYTVYTYSFTIDNDGTITLVNVEDNSKQILGSMYK